VSVLLVLLHVTGYNTASVIKHSKCFRRGIYQNISREKTSTLPFLGGVVNRQKLSLIYPCITTVLDYSLPTMPGKRQHCQWLTINKGYFKHLFCIVAAADLLYTLHNCLLHVLCVFQEESHQTKEPRLNTRQNIHS